MTSETTEMHNRLSTLQSDIESITSDFADLCVRSDKDEKELKSKIEQLQKQLEEQKKENERLKEEIESQKDKIYKYETEIMMIDEIDYLKSQKKELEEKIEALELRNTRLFHENHDFSHSNRFTACENDRLKKEIEDLKAKCDEFQKFQDSCAEHIPRVIRCLKEAKEENEQFYQVFKKLGLKVVKSEYFNNTKLSLQVRTQY